MHLKSFRFLAFGGSPEEECCDYVIHFYPNLYLQEWSEQRRSGQYLGLSPRESIIRISNSTSLVLADSVIAAPLLIPAVMLVLKPVTTFHVYRTYKSACAKSAEPNLDSLGSLILEPGQPSMVLSIWHVANTECLQAPYRCISSSARRGSHVHKSAMQVMRAI